MSRKCWICFHFPFFAGRNALMNVKTDDELPSVNLRLWSIENLNAICPKLVGHLVHTASLEIEKLNLFNTTKKHPRYSAVKKVLLQLVACKCENRRQEFRESG